MAEFVEVSVPARAEFLSLARMAVGTVASRLGLTIDELDDLQLAAEELCLSVLRPAGAGGGQLEVRLAWDAETIEVRCRVPGAPASAATVGDGLPETLSGQILDALVDAHGRTEEDGTEVAWLRKRREHPLPPT